MYNLTNAIKTFFAIFFRSMKHSSAEEVRGHHNTVFDCQLGQYPKTMTRSVVLNIAGCFSADHLHENGAVIGIQDGAEDDSRKH